MRKIFVSGYCSIDRIVKLDKEPTVGFTSIILNQDSYKPYFGGCSVNISAILSKIGIKATPIIRVGEDYEETGFEQFFKDHNVDMSMIKKISNQATSHTFLLETQNGNHVTLFHPGAMDSTLFINYDEKDFKDVEMLIMVINSFKDNKALLEIVKKNNISLVLGMKLDEEGFPKELLKEILDEVKILFANEEEAKEIVKLYELSSINDLFNNKKLELIVITKGSAGSEIITKNENIDVPRFPLSKIIDTAGAGDAYIAGFMYGYLSGNDLLTAGKMGSVMASFILQTVGCTTNIPTEEQFLKRYNKF